VLLLIVDAPLLSASASYVSTIGREAAARHPSQLLTRFAACRPARVDGLMQGGS
jgi:hypothetical protein